MEEFIIQLKINRIVRYSVISGFVLLTYVISGNWFTVFVALIGLILGRISYNDHVEDMDI